LLDALSYCIFDKCSRTKFAGDVLNNQRSQFSCKFNFEIDGVDYYIERIGKKHVSNIIHIEATELEYKMYERLRSKQKLQGLLLDLIEKERR